MSLTGTPAIEVQVKKRNVWVRKSDKGRKIRTVIVDVPSLMVPMDGEPPEIFAARRLVNSYDQGSGGKEYIYRDQGPIQNPSSYRIENGFLGRPAQSVHRRWSSSTGDAMYSEHLPTNEYEQPHQSGNSNISFYVNTPAGIKTENIDRNRQSVLNLEDSVHPIPMGPRESSGRYQLPALQDSYYRNGDRVGPRQQSRVPFTASDSWGGDIPRAAPFGPNSHPPAGGNHMPQQFSSSSRERSLLRGRRVPRGKEKAFSPVRDEYNSRPQRYSPRPRERSSPGGGESAWSSDDDNSMYR